MKFQSNMLTIGEQYSAIENFYNLLLTEFCHVGLILGIDLF